MVSIWSFAVWIETRYLKNTMIPTGLSRLKNYRRKQCMHIIPSTQNVTLSYVLWKKCSEDIVHFMFKFSPEKQFKLEKWNKKTLTNNFHWSSIKPAKNATQIYINNISLCDIVKHFDGHPSHLVCRIIKSRT